MGLPSRRAGLVLALIALFSVGAGATSVLLRDPIDPLRISYNDMEEAAGDAAGGVVQVSLEARAGEWRPDGPDGVVIRVAAFGERGGALEVPGPLLRLRVGEEARVTVRNALSDPLVMYGLGSSRGVAGEGVSIEPGAAHEFRFMADAPGVYYYAGRTTDVPELMARTGFDSQLNGALVVDAADAPARPRDRLFLISQWWTLDSTSVSGLGPHPILAINGRMWPHTEVLEAVQGDSLHWRLINTTILPHPMHLHGFYFRVDAQGDGASWRELPVAERYRAVTELMLPGRTLALTWSPERPGNWVFHCHFAGHMASDQALNQDRRHPVTLAALAGGGSDDHAAHPAARGPSVRPVSQPALSRDELGAHAQHNMSGLVLGIKVKPRGRQPAAAANARALRLLLRSVPAVYGEYTGYGFVLGGSAEEADPAALSIPGPTLVLERGRPVAIALINQSHEPAAVHWHGIELESLPDGVPGWSGAGRRTLPLIAPGDSLTVRFTPPRAGTFMYHSHFNEYQQISSGMYGAIVVLEPGARHDPERDRILLFSDGGPIVNVISGPFPPVLLNGAEQPAPMTFRAGETYRLRLVNILSEGIVHVSLRDGDRPLEWQIVARDGADLPAHQVRTVPAELTFASGTIQDVMFRPVRTGELTLRFGVVVPDEPPPPTLVRVAVR